MKLNDVAGRIGSTQALEAPAKQLAAVAKKLIPAGPLNGEARNSVKHCPCAEPVATSRVTANAARRAPRRFMAASLVNPRSTRRGPRTRIDRQFTR